MSGRWATAGATANAMQRAPRLSATLHGRYAASVGASLWQTPGGVQAEIERINDDMHVFSSEITSAVRARGLDATDIATIPISQTEEMRIALEKFGLHVPDWNNLAQNAISAVQTTAAAAHAAAQQLTHPSSPIRSTDPLVTFYLSTWVPFILRWKAFFEANKGWTDNFWWNHAPEAEQFLDQLVQIRTTAGMLGMQVLSPKPSTWGKSILDPSRDPTKPILDGVEEAMKILKWAAIGALGIGGAFGVAKVVEAFKKK